MANIRAPLKLKSATSLTGLDNNEIFFNNNNIKIVGTSISKNIADEMANTIAAQLYLGDDVIPFHAIWGFDLDMNNSNPYTNITYTNDAVEFQPLTFNDDCTPIYGSWYNIIKKAIGCRLCAFDYHQNFIAYLNENDVTKTEDGRSIDPTKYNIMVEFNPLYYKITTSGYILSFRLATYKVDDTYVQYAFATQGKIHEKLYISKYMNRFESTDKIGVNWYSIDNVKTNEYYISSSGKAPTSTSGIALKNNTQYAENDVNKSQFNDANYTRMLPLTYHSYLYIVMISMMITKSSAATELGRLPSNIEINTGVFTLTDYGYTTFCIDLSEYYGLTGKSNNSGLFFANKYYEFYPESDKSHAYSCAFGLENFFFSNIALSGIKPNISAGSSILRTIRVCNPLYNEYDDTIADRFVTTTDNTLSTNFVTSADGYANRILMNNTYYFPSITEVYGSSSTYLCSFVTRNYYYSPNGIYMYNLGFSSVGISTGQFPSYFGGNFGIGTDQTSPILTNRCAFVRKKTTV